MLKSNSIKILVLFLTLSYSCKTSTEQDKNHKHTNELIGETSPYLLQHAHNPVDWRAWSKEALDQAEKEDKLVLVSIGYSSCHWCHVMEEETFEKEEVAKIMNDNFISIKVDREERPDIDHIYQTAIQLVKGTGGWPLNAIILPNGKPIYLGTYHSKDEWNKVLSRFSSEYAEDPEKMIAYADMLAQGVQDENLIKLSGDFEVLNKTNLEEIIENWKPFWDLEWGGEKAAEKFITPVRLEFLMEYAVLTENDTVMNHVENTLNKIALGGIYDHLGGGFFRYSTDSKWKVPHFEKMLYDNAQLLSLYSKAYKVFGHSSYKKVVLETFAFLEREMKNTEGGYYAAIDADSDGEEGKFYVWKKEDLEMLLKDDFELFSKYFNTTSGKEWEDQNFVLHKTQDDETFCTQNSISKEELDARLSSWKKILLEHRGQRIHPNKDDKIITSWNALLINGLLESYKTFGNEEFLKSAESIFEFISANSLEGDKLIHSYKKGGKHVNGFLEDYTVLANAALNLYSVSLEDKYLNLAKSLNQKALKQFEDAESGMFRYKEDEVLISKIIKTDDGIWPSPNSVMAHNLFQLGHIEYNKEFLKKSKTMLSTIMPLMTKFPQSHANWSMLLLQNTYPYYEIAVVGKEALPMVKELNKRYIPNALVVASTVDSDLPLFKSRFIDEVTYIYVCQNNTCRLPVETVDEALSQLKSITRK